MKIQILLSTMNQIDYSILDEAKILEPFIVINQNKKENIQRKGEASYWIDSHERGLSKSRNLAIQYAESDIGVFSDDDMIYVPNYQQIISKQFEENQEYDVIAFQVEGIEKNFKIYEKKHRPINFFKVRQISSVEIAFKLSSIKKAKIFFDEQFGSGAKFNHGEESIFLHDCLKKGLKILYVPVKIADLHIGNSTWFKGYNKKYLISNGAIFDRLYASWSFLFMIRFACVHYHYYSQQSSFWQAIKYMLIGRKLYKKQKDEKLKLKS